MLLVHSSAKILYSLHPRIEFPIGIVRFFFLLFFIIEYRVVILFYLGRMFFQAAHSVGDYRLVKQFAGAEARAFKGQQVVLSE